jgi:hypothetical protein
MYVHVFLHCDVCVGTNLAMGRSPIQGALPTGLNGFMVSEVQNQITPETTTTTTTTTKKADKNIRR